MKLDPAALEALQRPEPPELLSADAIAATLLEHYAGDRGGDWDRDAEPGRDRARLQLARRLVPHRRVHERVAPRETREERCREHGDECRGDEGEEGCGLERAHGAIP